MSEITVYNGKRYMDCSRCGGEQWLHDDGCHNCQYVIDQGLCWGCIIDDAIPPEQRFPKVGESISDERLNAIIATGPQVVSFGVDQGDECD